MDRSSEPVGYDRGADIPVLRFNRTRRGAITFVLATAAVGLVTAIFYQQIAVFAGSIIPTCIFARFGLRCAMCGGTRCVGALLRGHFARAVYYNPLALVMLAILGYMYLRLVLSCFGRQYRPYSPKITEKTLWIVIGVLIAFTIVRNLPFYRSILF